MADAYVRTGRGGSGNFRSQDDVNEVLTRARTEDLEAQKPTWPIPSTPSEPSAYVRSGRGGAGNFTTTSSDNNNNNSGPALPTTTTTAVADTSSTPRARYAGRGGAGNWVTTTTEHDDDDDDEEESGTGTVSSRAKKDQDARRKEALDAGIAQEIRASLPQPPRTYHQHAPGRGRRPEDEETEC